MRVLFWTGSFWPSIGGVEVLAAKLLPDLRDRGYEFITVAPKNGANWPDVADYKGIPVYRFPFHNNLTDRSIDNLVELRQKLAALKSAFAPDLIHINTVGVQNFFHLLTANAHRAPMLVTLHGKWPSQADVIVAKTLRAADWVAGCSAAILEEGRKLAPEITPRSSIVYNGVATPRVLPSRLSFDPPRLLCLGRLAPEKGIDLALAAFGMISQRYPRARLVIAGDGPARSELEMQAADRHLSHAVEFVGWVAPDRVPDLINHSTIVLMPSREDSFPLVALEAGALARPIVATRVGGLPEIVQHQESGLLVDKEDSRGFAAAIAFLLENPETAVRMGQAADHRVRTMFGWKSHVDAYDALYNDVVQRSRTASGAL